MRKCTIEGCGEPHYARGWCAPHYNLWRRNGDPLLSKKRPSRAGVVCSIEGCEKNVEARGWCPSHYYRWYNYGDPNANSYFAGRVKVGDVFTRLTVVELLPPLDGVNYRARCLCVCGEERIVNRGNLKAEKTTSCGCLQQELRLRRAYDNRSVDVGEVFGRLTVTKLLPAQKAAVVCECGAHKVLPRHALRQGHTRSCGCYLRDVLRERNHVPGSVPGYRSLAKSNGTFTYKDWEKLLVRWNFSCYYCGVVAPLEKDHIIPLSRGGRHSIGNILPACRLCNASKGAQLLVEWKYLRRRTATKRNLV